MQDQPPAPYLALVAVVQLNTLFNAISTGISNGQEDVIGLMGNLTSTFVPPDSDDSNAFLDGFLSVFLGPLISAIAGLFVPVFGPEIGVIVTGGATILGAGVESIFKDPSLPNTALTDASTADVYVTRFSEGARDSLGNWTTDTFAGKQDLNNKTIIDYMSGGVFINSSLPQASDVEAFYKKQMVSRTVQGLWQTNFVPFIVTYSLTDKGCTDELSDDIPHYFDASQCVQSVLKVKGSMDDNTAPYGWEQLQGSNYNITIQDIIISSVRSWAVARNDYSISIAAERLEQIVSASPIPLPPLPGPSPTPSSPSSFPSAFPSSFPSGSPSPPPTPDPGSLEQCGNSNNSAVCAQGLCCSQNDYCGSSSDYCVNCQPEFGADCSSSSSYLFTRQDAPPTSSSASNGGILYGPFTKTGNWSYSLVANQSSPFAEGAAFEGTWQIPVCERTSDTCFDLSNGDGSGETTVVKLCCGNKCVDTELFKNATAWDSSDNPGDLTEDDADAGELQMYGYCSDDEESVGAWGRRVDGWAVVVMGIGWGLVFLIGWI
ncbi:hypothetical protein MMC10_011029 [Thelotrema lepadinum]|nr:hypothetical protein [Thelotrema lepadinum]